MKTRQTVMLIAGVGMLAWGGCSPKEDNPTPVTSAGDAVDRAAESARNAAAATGAALTTTWDNVKDATYDERARLQTSLDNLSRSVDAKFDELQARGANATGATNETWNRGLDELRSARTVLKEKINDLGKATAETWDRAKADVETAWENVRRSYADLETQRASP